MNENLVVINRKFSMFDLLYCGHMECLPGWESTGSLHKGILIHYVKKGKGIFKTGNKKYEIDRNYSFIGYPDKSSFYKADDNDPWEYMWICFAGGKLMEYVYDNKLSPENCVHYHKEFHRINSLFERIFSYAPTGSITDELFYTSIITTLLYLTRDGESVDDITNTPINTNNDLSIEKMYIHKSLCYIYQNYFDDITIVDISEHVGLDRSYFSKIFKKHMNIPPICYLTKYRINKACSLLETTDLRIEEIANKTGYSYTHHFSEVFKKNLGVSPSIYREENQLKV